VECLHEFKWVPGLVLRVTERSGGFGILSMIDDSLVEVVLDEGCVFMFPATYVRFRKEARLVIEEAQQTLSRLEEAQRLAFRALVTWRKKVLWDDAKSIVETHKELVRLTDKFLMEEDLLEQSIQRIQSLIRSKPKTEDLIST